jgi:4-amino-4-deoxy-L-arabinose transferase-like glycosyltransferase
MTQHAARWIWWLLATVIVLLPLLPIPQWSGAPDPGPVWWSDVAAWGIGLLVVCVSGVLAGRLATRLLPDRFSVPKISDRVLVAALAALAVGLSVYAMRAVFAANPHLVDEVAQLLHARALAAGQITPPAPEPIEAFLVTHTTVTEAGWVSQYPPGQAVLLALGLVARVEWLVNPVLGGIGVVLVYLVTRGLYEEKTARVAAVLWAVSAWVMFMSGTYMNHVGAVTFALAAWALLWVPRRLGAMHCVFAGLAIGAAVVTRPLDGVAAGLPILLWVIVTRRWRAIPWVTLGGIPVAIAWGYVNWRLYGHPLTLGYILV